VRGALLEEDLPITVEISQVIFCKKYGKFTGYWRYSKGKKEHLSMSISWGYINNINQQYV